MADYETPSVATTANILCRLFSKIYLRSAPYVGKTSTSSEHLSLKWGIKRAIKFYIKQKMKKKIKMVKHDDQPFLYVKSVNTYVFPLLL